MDKIGGQWEAAVQHRELSSLLGALEGWDEARDQGLKDTGYMYTDS